ncbi:MULTISPECIES: LysR family transcriptional regulator [unclassified Brenneria]|uniref:LysR family transcriptional regulator n=1 Tax=unclassified Brenneria TaxID=2634434 RepID=UPI001552C98C|nr:LysR family transcriptional regulator [Brenneria sp. hezel4-2-4]MEE3650988.1 LysR family transcriptional regulator [Brenneria sp. HEZEL_4_2_4]NPD00943.1 LysR family transcriptional regulator [Brenneria sp. hezel4-2-4]
MLKHIPNLNAIHAVVICSKFCSISKTALFLHKTQGAVSRQIKQIEEMYGLTIFERSLSGMVLTPDGERFVETCKQILEMAEYLNFSVKKNKRTFIIRSPSTFAINLLMPNYQRLRSVIADEYLKIDTSFDDLQKQESEPGDTIDVIITRGEQGLPSFIAIELFSETLNMACTPAIGHQINADAEEISKLCLIKSDKSMHNWSHWLRDNGLPFLTDMNTVTFDTLEISMSAAEIGVGLVLTDPLMATSRVQNNKLIFPFPNSIKTGKNYYINIPERNRQDKKITLLVNEIKNLSYL